MTFAMRYRLAIFDFDGTLADSLSWSIGAMNELADRYRFRRVLEEEIETIRGWEVRRIVDHLGVPAWRMPVIVRQMRERMASDIGRIPLFPGVERMLEELEARGVAIAIVTSNSEANARGILGERNAARVRHFGCGASIFGKRPKLRRVLRASGIPAARAIAIGDEIRDVDAARAEGIPFGAVSWGYASREALAAQHPAEIFDSVDEIVERLT
jgi:phosphoglycolate phosphatase